MLNKKLHKLGNMLLDNGTQEQLDLLEEIESDELHKIYSQIDSLRLENERLKEELGKYKRIYDNAVIERTRWA